MKLYFDEKTIKKQGYSYEVKSKSDTLIVKLKKFGIPVGTAEISADVAKQFNNDLTKAISEME